MAGGWPPANVLLKWGSMIFSISKDNGIEVDIRTIEDVI
jgi:hypothetical protein